MIRLMLKPHIEKYIGCHLDRFDAWFEDEWICTSRQPLYDGARELLRRGHLPSMPLTIHHAGKPHDIFEPTTVGEAAKWTVEETKSGGMKRRRWKPFQPSRLVDIASPACSD